MPLTKTQVFAALDTAVGNNLDLRGDPLNALLKDMYESIEQLVNDEAAARATAIANETDARNLAIYDEATSRLAADQALDGRLDIVEPIVTDHEGRLDIIEAIITALQEDYVLAGMAVPATDPGTPVLKTAYLAKTNGTYTNFVTDENVAYTVSDELVLFLVRPGNATIKNTLVTL